MGINIFTVPVLYNFVQLLCHSKCLVTIFIWEEFFRLDIVLKCCHFFLNFGALLETLLNWSHQLPNAPKIRHCRQSRNMSLKCAKSDIWKQQHHWFNIDSCVCPLGAPEAWLRHINFILWVCLQFWNWRTFWFWWYQFKSVSKRAPKIKKKWQRFDTISRQRNTSYMYLHYTS